LQQHRNIEVSGATLECTLYGSGTPVVLLANAGCSSGYFDDLARALAAGGLQAICVNMRGTGESRGSLDGITVHDLAADVAGVLEALDCGPAHLVGHAFGNRVARCLALEDWWGAGTAPLLVIQGLDDEAAPPGNGHALREQFDERVRVIDLPRAGHFLVLEQPEAVTRAIAEFVGAGAGPR